MDMITGVTTACLTSLGGIVVAIVVVLVAIALFSLVLLKA